MATEILRIFDKIKKIDRQNKKKLTESLQQNG
jgi:hypothetical protein